MPVSYVLPIKTGAVDDDLASYLHRLVGWVDDVVVVDGSPDSVHAVHTRRWPAAVRHLRPALATSMGKVGGVLTGLDAARHDVVVVADDDVRWTAEQLRDAEARMAGCDVLRPQNRFAPATAWHAKWDTGRILLNRVTGGDWPGTLVVRRTALPGGYAGDVLFENLELVRTVRVNGGRSCLALDLVVDRRPPTTRTFFEQRARQAYDEWARPLRLVTQLALLPAVVVGRRRAVLGLAASAVAAAEVGRRRGGVRCWGPTASLWAPVWLVERALTSWVAVGSRLRGGARYRGGRLAIAANPERRLRRQVRSPSVAPSSPG